MQRRRTRDAGAEVHRLAWRFVGVLAVWLCLLVPSAHAVTIDWVTVGDAGNAADTNGYGVVTNAFRIMKFEWTNSQYVDFLNAVDPTGATPNGIYDPPMGSDSRGGISLVGANPTGSKYVARTNMGDKPVNWVDWFDAARVANWLQNGQGSGSTETGAYTFVGGQTSGTAPAVNDNALFWIPTTNEWYKAAYYQGGGTNAGYWAYATQSNTAPTTVTANAVGLGSAGSTGNFANYNNAADWNGQNGNVTTVGSNGGPSVYGTFDMTGNAWEWTDLTAVAGTQRGLWGGGYDNNATQVSSSETLHLFNTEYEYNNLTFRLASSVAVPEPSNWAMALMGGACGGWGMWRRRRAAISWGSFRAAALRGLGAVLPWCCVGTRSVCLRRLQVLMSHNVYYVNCSI